MTFFFEFACFSDPVGELFVTGAFSVNFGAYKRLKRGIRRENARLLGRNKHGSFLCVENRVK